MNSLSMDAIQSKTVTIVITAVAVLLYLRGIKCTSFAFCTTITKPNDSHNDFVCKFLIVKKVILKSAPDQQCHKSPKIRLVKTWNPLPADLFSVIRYNLGLFKVRMNNYYLEVHASSEFSIRRNGGQMCAYFEINNKQR